MYRQILVKSSDSNLQCILWRDSPDQEIKHFSLCVKGGFTQQLAPIQEPASNQHFTLIIEEFEPDVFRQLIEYIDTGCVTLQPRTLLGEVLEFVDEHGNEVLNLGSFTLLPQHVVRLILAREELRADEFTKFQAALMWSKKYCDSNRNMVLKDVIGNFLEYIQFHKIPANVLMREVHPLGLVPYSIIMNVIK
ncbi:serine-enriched protein-like [Lycorma delicatula]|uniref:serine-enriched protein-like n=1 Tax=Lycorma delicatula TaxID=130591 RepID=UPI003F514373